MATRKPAKKSKGSIVVADDLDIGDFVIVRQFHEPQVNEWSEMSQAMAAQRRQKTEHLIGMPLRVLGIALPFLAVQFTPKQPISNPFASMFGGDSSNISGVLSLDIRSCELMKTSPEFALAFAPISTRKTTSE